MNAFQLCASIALGFTLLACGRADDSELSLEKQATLTTAVPRFTDSEPRYLWHPFGETSKCIGNGNTRVTDHTVNPPRVTYKFQPKILDCGSTTLPSPWTIKLVNWSNKRPYEGGRAFVQIKLGDYQCLTHPGIYLGNGADDGSLRWEPCADLNNPAPEAWRQNFEIAPLPNGATAIATRFQFMTAKPNPQEECIGRDDRLTSYLKRTTCVGRTMWTFSRIN